MNIDRLRTVIGEIEAPTKTTHELNVLIFEVVNGRQPHRSSFEQYEPSERVPNYLDSYDDAVRLIPDGWFEELFRLSAEKFHVMLKDLRPGYIATTVEGYGIKRARAMCLAALKAQMIHEGTK